jgi:hypothetical protein
MPSWVGLLIALVIGQTILRTPQVVRLRSLGLVYRHQDANRVSSLRHLAEGQNPMARVHEAVGRTIASVNDSVALANNASR